MPVAPSITGAALWMLGALASFAAMAVGGRELSVELGTFEILFLRSMVGLLALIALLAAHGGAAQLRTRRLGLHLVRNLAHFGGQYGWFLGLALAIVFYMTVMQLPMGLVPALPDWHWPSTALWPWVIVVGLAALVAHYCIARAMMLADAMVVVPMDFLRLPLIAVVGALFYAEPLDPWVFAGAALMVAGNLLNLRAGRAPPPG